ncbi:6-phosphogluconolactonase [Flavimarina sp. Hel_I_48]|uniref:6-phosphogluconolactonase n=1 Tax=Flavimarina sp. Hel_I_48 TaxID=1392488 RepID=UPI0004DF1E66|nr:6-phosphogluconolactonase [Flavimarina sp. Hel_I_48]
MDLHVNDTKQEVAENFSKYFRNAAHDTDVFRVALSGGSTPKIVFDFMAEHYKEEVDWSRVHFFWGDERCVPPTDEQSNYKMTRDHLLSKIDVPEANIFRIKGENDSEEEAKRYSEVLEKDLPSANGLPQFDLVILGMGGDGHTASIFPSEIHLWDEKAYCAVATHPESGQKRVGLTGGIINNAKTVAFLVTGNDKTEKVSEIIGQKSGYKAYPASKVNPKSGDLQWFLDANAASGLS